MIKKISSYIFSIGIIAVLLFTCVTGVRVIGKSLYVYYKGADLKNPIAAIDGLFESIDSGFTDAFALRGKCIDIYGLLQRGMDKKIVYDADDDKTVLKGSDNKLYFKGNAIGEKKSDDTQLKNNAEAVVELYKYVADKNGTFLFVTAPDKYDSEQLRLPLEGITDYSDKANRFDEMLDNNGVPHLNLKKELKEYSDNYSDNFFITDHHWRIETAFWGFQQIAGCFNSRYEYNIDSRLYDKDSYNVETEPNCFLGSMGVRVGKYYAGSDDIAVISPEFETLFDVEYSSKTLGTNVSRHGSYKEAVLEGKPSYGMYITTDNPVIHVDNLLNNSGHNILLIKDSFGVPVAAWLSCIADNLWEVDLRYAQEESVYDFIESKSIDTVIVLYNSQMLETGTVFNFTEISQGK